MAEIKPFRGYYYNQGIINPEKVVSPPHDVISKEGQDRYYNSSPYNVVRLILGKEYDSDDSQHNRYSRAADYLNDWINKKIIVRDETDAIYAYEQTYTVGKKKRRHMGMIALVKLEPFEKKIVLPHEEISDKSMSDRYGLMKACNANMSLIISLYSDRKRVMEKVLRKQAKDKPFIAVTDGDEIEHRIWRIHDKTAIDKLSSALGGKKLWIADGHHRYTTSLKHSQRKKDPEAKYMMMALFSMEDDLTVLPAHRVVKVPAIDFKKEFGRLFDIEPHKMKPASTKDSHKFGVYYAGKYCTLKLKKTVDLDKVIRGAKSKAWKRLDVTVLHTLILEKLNLRNNNILFTKDEDKAISLVDSGKYQVAFFLNPTRVEQVKEIAQNGERMPQKSTYFYPKPLSGLIIRKF